MDPDILSLLREARDKMHAKCNDLHQKGRALERDAEGSSLGCFLPHALAGIRADTYRQMDKARKAGDRAMLDILRRHL
jgi:hypothetical protein